MTLNEFQYIAKSDKTIGKHKKIPNKFFNKKELKIGIETEMEHTDDPKIAEAIAKDHLIEVPNYYTLLKKMESQGKSYWVNKKEKVTSKDNGHTHTYKVDEEGDGRTIETDGSEAHVHKIKNYMVQIKNNHIHILT